LEFDPTIPSKARSPRPSSADHSAEQADFNRPLASNKWGPKCVPPRSPVKRPIGVRGTVRQMTRARYLCRVGGRLVHRLRMARLIGAATGPRKRPTATSPRRAPRWRRPSPSPYSTGCPYGAPRPMTWRTTSRERRGRPGRTTGRPDRHRPAPRSQARESGEDRAACCQKTRPPTRRPTVYLCGRA
jgi:hypothetical protein